MVLHHGWGLNSKMWEKFSNFFSEITIHNLDRGYFYEEKRASIISNFSYKIGIVHSLGLHLFPKELFSSLNILIIFSSFLDFQKSRGKVISLMKKKLFENPQVLLDDFYKEAFSSKNYKSEIIEKDKINIERLDRDLSLLENSSFELDLIKDIPKILLFHSEEDKIVSLEEALKLKKKLPHIDLHTFNTSSHMLPSTHLDQIIPIIKKNIPYEESIFKRKVSYSFSKEIQNYEKNSHFQKKVSNDLLEHLIKYSDKKINGPILEIGAGTGDFTKKLLNHFPDEKIEITDLSQTMVDHCKNLFLSDNTSFFVLDGEKLNKNNFYALIVSSMTIQWFYDLEKSFKLIKKSLKKEGAFYFSFLEKSSFEELINLPLIATSLNPLPSMEEINYYLNENSFSFYDLQKKSYSFTYPSILSFLQSLKKTGATASFCQKSKNFYSLLELIKKNDLASFPVTYNVGIAVAIK